MVLVILNTIKFEAEKFETRTMPTPDLKSKEVIYWIRVNTPDKRLVMDLQRFLEAPSQYIELHVPSAFVSVKAELENYRPSGKVTSVEGKRRGNSNTSKLDSVERESVELDNERFLLEIILRRSLPDSRGALHQSPYG